MLGCQLKNGVMLHPMLWLHHTLAQPIRASCSACSSTLRLRYLTESILVLKSLSLSRHHALVLSYSLFNDEQVGLQLLPSRFKLCPSPLHLRHCSLYLVKGKALAVALVAGDDQFFEELLVLDETLVISEAVMNPFFKVAQEFSI